MGLNLALVHRSTGGALLTATSHIDSAGWEAKLAKSPVWSRQAVVPAVTLVQLLAQAAGWRVREGVQCIGFVVVESAFISRSSLSM